MTNRQPRETYIVALRPLPGIDAIRALKANGLRCVSISTAQAGDVMGAQRKA